MGSDPCKEELLVHFIFSHFFDFLTDLVETVAHLSIFYVEPKEQTLKGRDKCNAEAPAWAAVALAASLTISKLATLS